MPRAFVTKTSFTAGELDPRLLGRLDLKAQEDGAARLRNVLVQATGGVARRPGLARVADLPGARRLIAFEAPHGPALVALGADRVHVFRDGRVIAGPEGVWTEAQLADVDWTRSGDRLLIVHPDVPPMALVEPVEGTFELEELRYDSSGEAPPVRTFQAYARFVPAGVRLELRDPRTNRSDAAIEAGPVLIVTSPPALTSAHEGATIRYKGAEVTVVSVDPLDPRQATGLLHERLNDGSPSWEWDEQAFGPARGWPATITVYQDRLVIGGSRDLPDWVWMSGAGRHANFDLGEGLDDEAISFRLGGDEAHAIRALQPGRQLQVFTTAGEWVVRGAPVTPGDVQLELQTRIGSWVPRRLRPVDVDGATLFVGASGRELREFLFADSEQAYQAADIALLARHLLVDPVDVAFDSRRRLLLIPRSDGSAAAVTIDRNSNVVGWSLLRAAGGLRAVAAHRGEAWFLVDLEGRVSLERLDDELGVDHARDLASPGGVPRDRWAGLDDLEGWPVMAVDEGGGVTRARVEAGAIKTARPARRLTVGLPFSHEVEPMPVAVATGRGVSLDHPYRPVRVTFRVLETGALRADLGDGPRPVLSPEAADATTGRRFTGDLGLRALGWRRGLGEPPWRVSQDDPAPVTILSVTTEIKVND